MGLDFDRIRELDELKPLVKGPLTKDMFKAYGPAALDPNPIHVDDDFAKQSGYPGVFAHGMLSMGYLGELLVANSGVGKIRRFKVRFKTQSWPGETITCGGTITRKYENDGERLVDCAIYTENEKHERKIEGTATLVL